MVARFRFSFRSDVSFWQSLHAVQLFHRLMQGRSVSDKVGRGPMSKQTRTSRGSHVSLVGEERQLFSQRFFWALERAREAVEAMGGVCRIGGVDEMEVISSSANAEMTTEWKAVMAVLRKEEGQEMREWAMALSRGEESALREEREKRRERKVKQMLETWMRPKQDDKRERKKKRTFEKPVVNTAKKEKKKKRKKEDVPKKKKIESVKQEKKRSKKRIRVVVVSEEEEDVVGSDWVDVLQRMKESVADTLNVQSCYGRRLYVGSLCPPDCRLLDASEGEKIARNPSSLAESPVSVS